MEVPPGGRKTIVKDTEKLNVTKANATVNTKKCDYLKRCYDSIVSKEVLRLNTQRIGEMMIADLGVDFKSFSAKMKFIISEALCMYMRIWPGWHVEEYKTNFQRVECFDMFKEYVKFKVNYVIKNQQKFCPNKPRTPPDTASVGVQTELLPTSCKPEANYTLVISGQPNVLNNIVFVEVNNDIVIKQHTEKPWKHLCVNEFLNYPYVQAHVDIPGVHLSRGNLHEYKRYITECGDVATPPDVNFINQVVKVNEQMESKAFSFDFIAAYFDQFIRIIKTLEGVKSVPELEAIFNEFLQDIKESNVYHETVAAPYSVYYNIGRKTYIRNKKMVFNNKSSSKERSKAINFCEILIPKLVFTLSEFNVEEDTSAQEQSFVDLNRIKVMSLEEKQKFVQMLNSCVSYQCLWCPKTFSGDLAYVEVMDHFRFQHKGEQGLLCFKCRQQFGIPTLAGSRWGHECSVRKTNTTANAVTTSKPNPAGVTVAKEQ